MTTKFGSHCGTFSQTALSHVVRTDGTVIDSQSDLVGGFFRQSFSNGVSNPNWKSMVKHNQDATTPFTGREYSQSVSFGSDYVTWKPVNPALTFNKEGREEFYGYGSNTMNANFSNEAPSDVITKADNRAIASFISRCDSIRSSVEAGQDIGELKQTLEGILNPLGSLRKHTLGYFDELKKARRNTKRVHLRKALTDTYLEFNFGWRPLASDIADAIVGLQNRNRMQEIMPVSASATEHYYGTMDSYVHSNNPIFIHNGFVKSTSQFSVRYKGKVRVGLVNGNIPIAQALQLDLPHFVPTVWDLIPYSFVVDYFTNIGNIVRAASFCSSDIVYCCKTTRDTSVREYAPLGSFKFQNPAQYEITSQTASSARSSFKVVNVSRGSAKPSSLVPSLQFSLPIHNKPWLNIGALMSSRIKSLVPFR